MNQGRIPSEKNRNDWLEISQHATPKDIEVWIMQKDPLVARGEQTDEHFGGNEETRIGLSKVTISGETTIGIGPTSARITVIDYDMTHDQLIEGAELHSDGDRFKSSFKFDNGRDVDGNSVFNLSEKEISLIETDLHFHQVNVWATIHNTMTLLEQSDILGRRIPWAFKEGRIKILPHACYDENAYYDPDSGAICFGYYYNTSDIAEASEEKKMVFTCLSHDVVTHELGHAILDGLKPYYMKCTSAATAGFHEYFGDAIAITSTLSNRELVVQVAGRDDSVLKHNNPIANIAKELGQSLNVAHDYVRNAQNKKTVEDLTEAQMNSEHDYSEILTGAYYDLLERAYLHRIEQLKGKDEQGTTKGASGGGDDGITGQTRVAALHQAAAITRRMMLRALDYCPPVDLNFLDYAQAVFRADKMAHPRGDDIYRQMWLWVCIDRKICSTAPKGSADAGRDPLQIARDQIDPPNMISNKQLRGLDINKISSSETDAYEFIDANRETLSLPKTANIKVINLYRTNKTSSDNFRVPQEIIIEFVWVSDVKLENEPDGKNIFGELENTYANLWCGGTLVFTGEGNLLHYTVKNEDAQRRESLLSYMKYLCKEGYLEVEGAEKGLGASMVGKVGASVVDGKVILKRNAAMRCRREK